MISQKLKTSLHIFAAKCLIRIKRLKYVDYTIDDINSLIAPHIPITIPVSVPKGDGSFSIDSVNLTMPSDQIVAEIFGTLNVTYLANPIYRAHIVIVVKAQPKYDQTQKSITLVDLSIADIHMLQDEYSLLIDTTHLLSAFVPSPVLSMVTGGMKTAFNLMTGTSASDAKRYLELYLSGSKQKVLDYHKPQLENIITELAASEEMRYTLDPEDWEEMLFIKYGKETIVEDGYLRFKF